ncbi:MAG: DMT family transporter [Spirosomaceae bacterium]|jgi:transporter family-2 protein|nr:DMT family transporter [Spirosomataceae bacterium]
MNWILYLLAILCGVGTALQSGVNSQLRKSINNPLFAAVISFTVGFITILIIFPIFNKNALPSFSTLKSMEWWKWTGGFFGVFFVTTVIMTIDKVGSANMTALIVGGQLITAMVLDHYGFLGFNIHQINFWRVLGALLIVGGVYLVMKN